MLPEESAAAAEQLAAQSATLTDIGRQLRTLVDGGEAAPQLAELQEI